MLAEKVRRGKCAAAPRPGTDRCAAVEKDNLQLFSSVGGLT